MGVVGMGSAAHAETIGVCFDEADHTPYLHRNAAHEWQGATLDLTRTALARAGYTVKWLPMPWARCVREVEEYGSRKTAELLLYASLNPDRERKFLASVPVHQIQGGFWYSALRTPKATLPHKWSGLARYRLCGMFGHNYAWLSEYGISEVDSGALNLRAVFDKLERDRCDLVLSALEPVRGAAQLGFVSLPRDAAFLSYPDRPPVPQHLLLSRQSERASELHQRLNKALQELQASGEADRIYRTYLPDGDGLPP